MGLQQELKLLQALIRLSHKILLKRLQRHWRKTKPDLVVSLVPNFNYLMCSALAAALPQVPYVVVMTDLADYPPHFWIEPSQTQHIICGTARSVSQAQGISSAGSRIHATSGMIISPEFYGESCIDRDHEMRKLGLEPGRPTGLVLFGGHGSRAMQTIAARLDDIQLILICGHNAALAARLRKMPSAAPRHIVEFTTNVRLYMMISDFFVGKPGPGSLSEALHQKLPVIVVRNLWTMPQERYNTDWILETGTGIVLPSFKSIRGAVREMTARLDEFRRNAAAIRNNAVFEIPEILAGILGAGASTCDRPHRPHGHGIVHPISGTYTPGSQRKPSGGAGSAHEI